MHHLPHFQSPAAGQAGWVLALLLLLLLPGRQLPSLEVE
jgi:hypothetical protein